MHDYPTAGKQASLEALKREELVVKGDSMRSTRGGNFDHGEDNLRSARRAANSVSDQWAIIGFRIARTIPAEE
jgi:formylglycine-generating enzyme required for sulfatase activity